MASAEITYRSSTHTITIRVGTWVEHIDTEFKSKGELFDAVKYACISKGANISDIELTEILQEVRQT